MKILSAKIFNSSKCLLAAVTALLSLGASHSVMALNISQTPLFLAQPVRPIVMLNMSNDHQLYFKAYDDYSDLDGDGELDITYNNDFAYYGYFNSDLCYEHTGGVFTPRAWASNHYCTGSRWSGNFLNWATMTRIDTVRKILYGGKRSIDTAELTVLERAMLPQDAHSFAKYYNGTDINRLTPYSVTAGLSETANTGITICNTTNPSTRGHSQSVTSAPLMNVARGNYSLWASNERWQCRWGVNQNDNDSSITGIYAHSASPVEGTVGLDTLAVRVKACDPDFVNEENNENCRGYAGGNLKPTGLLQAYGEDDSILFGLMTGSYNKNKSGGVLRKNVSSMTNEINPIDGTFITPAAGGSIVASLDAMRIVGYNFSDGIYNNADNCPWALSSFADGRCTNWGNPQSEIYLESLRYLAGLAPTVAFDTNDSDKLAALSPVTWADPISDSNYCSPLNVIQFNASTSSYDGNQLSGAANIGLGNVSDATDKVGVGEGITGGSYFIGSNGTDNDQLCTPKTISNLSSISGTCPDAPRLEGTYQIAGLAYHARTEGIKDDRETVKTYGVALAPAVPKVDVPVPGGNSVVTILPACRNLQTNPDTNCAIVDFKVIETETVDGVNSGSLYVNWEDSEQGGDFDQDMWGLIKYAVSSEKVEITTEVVAQSTGDPMGFGYVISGTTDDGFHVHSGVNNFTYGDSCVMTTVWNDGASRNVSSCSCRFSGNNGRCSTALSQLGEVNTKAFEVGVSTARLLEQPLYYAAKWGGFEVEDNQGNTFTEPTDDTNPTYYFATDPRQLEASLKEAFSTAADGVGAAASVATNSTRIGTDTFIYQALFDSRNWFGDLKAFQISAQGAISSAPTWTASNVLGSHTARNIITYNGEDTVDFEFENLSDDQQTALNKNDTDALGAQRLRWLRGDNVTGFRARTGEQRIGDIVNSDPTFFGTKDYGFGRLTSHGGESYTAHVSSKEHEVIYASSNGGMLHAFDANIGNELFAYVPGGIYDKLSRLPDPNYGSSINPHIFTVDGQIVVSDIYAGGSWKTILVGALGAGGRGVFVLDVTDPNNPSVIGELNTADIGQVMGNPAVVPLPNGNWAIAFGNGYNSTGGQAKLILVQFNAAGTALADPVVMNTGVGGDNGLAEPSFSLKGDGTVKFAYAGDRRGNMWRFDMSNISSAPSLLFSSGAEQPITAAPVLGINTIKRDEYGSPTTMVYFGTGQYLTTADLENQDEQSFYGIADTGASLTRDDLHENTINAGTTRTVEEAQKDGELDWPSEDVHGWYVDFPAGERIVTKPMLLFDRLIFPTIVPNENPCQFGGSSWIMELVGVGNLYPEDYSFFEELIESDTFISLSDLMIPCTGPDCGCTGPDCGEPVPPEPDECDEGLIVVQKSDGTLSTINPCIPAGAFGPQSWRQLR
ncbi:MAG TPA: PilC/PilY family type IV pilus protein [Cellvibrionaceae bacterium]